MSVTRNWRDITLPDTMTHLARDKRGFPVPFIVARDNAGEPLFTVNDDRLTRQCIAESLCGICGNALTFGDLWWVGGPLSAFHPDGCYIDGPMHMECSTYALQVCPHLAAPRYTKRLDELPGMKNGMPFDILKDATMLPDRPLVFVQGQSESYDVAYPQRPQAHLYPVSGPDHKNATGRAKWKHYEVWQFGEIIEDEEQGLALIRQAFDEMPNQRVQAPKIITPPKAELIV